MSVRHLRGYGYADIARAAEGGPIPFTAATAGIKADGLDLQMSGLDLARYRNNPVIMYDHEYWGRDALPIGRAAEVTVEGDKLRALLDFDLEDDFAAKVDRKIRKGYLNAVSVGFGVHDIDEHGVPDMWELYEISVVPLPLDPDAIADPDRAGALALARALTGGRRGALDPDAVRAAITALQGMLPDQPPAKDPADDAARARRLRLLEATV
ncbi:hypothetical protein Aple_010660 [Acrocarpospora pleiomorpha]|uniref:Prohead serine protease domain-containing protein n=1 Tax=Acrocarpospora pleiomorpha TaxID=90975 RepID=A0A5M3XF04_9ACTN|nr:HK97 family phage prohead protease [Acrocarpospora pleiomorpha]GES18171.1 hypothetical protein Aple_010660 [Acrocarpospora pleiomorpha]